MLLGADIGVSFLSGGGSSPFASVARWLGGSPGGCGGGHIGRTHSAPDASTSGTRRRSRFVANATLKRRRQGYEGGDEGGDGGGSSGRRRAVIEYVRGVQPAEVQVFVDQAPMDVVQAFKQTVSNMVGTLPPQHFSVTIDTVAESLATLMSTMLRTGYLMRGAHYQLELELALQGAAVSMSAAPTAAAATVPSPPSPTAPAAGVMTAAQLLPRSPTSSSSSTTSGLRSLGPSPPGHPVPFLAPEAFIPEIVSDSSSSGDEAAPLTSQEGDAGTALAARGWQHPEEEYAPGVQLSRVEGHALRWHHTQGLERVPIQQYVASLEEQVRTLQLQLQSQQQSQLPVMPGFASGVGHLQPALFVPPAAGAASSKASDAPRSLPGLGLHPGIGSVLPASSGGGPHDLLAYLRGLDAKSLAALGACGQDVTDAMALFVGRLIGTSEPEHLRSMTSEFSAAELSKLLFWLLIVGWSLRALEVRWEVEEGFGGGGSWR